MKPNPKENYLYKTETIITIENTLELNKVHKTLLKRIIITDIILLIIFLIPSINSLKDGLKITSFLIGLSVVFGITDLLFCVTFNSSIKNFYNKIKHKKLMDLEYDIYFYKDYIERIGEHNSTRFTYEDILDILETNNCLFLKLDTNLYITIIKNNCSQELIDYIKQIKD